MVKIIYLLPQKIIEYSYYLLFLLVPLILTPFNFELFEYNKMMLTYGLATIIVGMWIVKMVVHRKLLFQRTPLDIPLLLFLLSQVISTFISIDRHVSIWGYYSRFNGGLLSTISYLSLYYAFVSNFPADKIRKLLKVALFSGLLVSVYGILEHLGIDKDIWVQDVQNRVFSTLGQPNWLAAYLSVLIPITIGIALTKFSNQLSDSNGKAQSSKLKAQNHILKFKIFNLEFIIFYLLSFIFYLTLIFTKSRSGFLGFWAADIVLGLLIFTRFKSNLFKPFLILNSLFLILTFILGAPFPEINRFSLSELTRNQQLNNRAIEQSNQPIGSSVIDVGITESGTIRKIVWKGAVDIFKNYPLFGSGVETFAFAYYKFRPVEHNMTSEWDFLYNKAHNEYLNYAATTGSFGIGSYLLIIVFFAIWNIKGIRNQESGIRNNKRLNKKEDSFIIHNSYFLILSLFAAWLSILITNFFGFSVVIIQLFFFLIPAISFVLNESLKPAAIGKLVSQSNNQGKQHLTFNIQQIMLITLVFFVICYMLYVIGRLWYADVVFADGYHKVRAGEIASAYPSLKKALEINESEPFYYDEFSYSAAQIAVAFADEKQATFSAALVKEATIASDYAVNQSPQNINYWKTRTRVFYVLSQIDEKYFADALEALEQAKILSPTDPKVRYNLSLLYDRVDKKKESLEEMIETTKLKPDYRDAYFALAYLYEKDNKRDKAKEALGYILEKIATDDAEARKKFEELK